MPVKIASRLGVATSIRALATAQTVSSGATGTRGTIATPSYLLGPVTFAKTGGSGNLTLSAGGVFANTAAIGGGVNQSLTGTITAADGVIVPIGISLTGAATVADAPALALTASNGQISLAWTDGNANGSAITAHKLYRGIASGGEALIGTITSGSPYLDTGLTNGQAYYYRLSAVNGIGESALSVEVGATPASTPAAPTMTLTAAPGQITIAWTDGANNGSAITSHKLYRSTSTGTEVLVGTISAASPFVDGSLTNGTRYYYRLSAVNGAGEGALSAEVNALPTASPAPVAQSTPTITGSTAQGATLTFAAPLYDVTPDSYELRITNGDGSTVYQDWTVVTNNTSVSAGSAGQTVVAHWRASKGGSTSAVSDSAPFGPITATQLVAAVAHTTSGAVPSGYTNIIPDSNTTTVPQSAVYSSASGTITNPNIPGLIFGYGGVGSQIAQSGVKSDPRLRGSSYMNSAGGYFVVDLPSAGTYDIYSSAGANATLNCGLEVWEGNINTGTLKASYEQTSVTAAQVIDINGTLTSVADWVAASFYGGVPKRITVTTPKLTFARRSGTGNTYLSSLAVVKVS